VRRMPGIAPEMTLEEFLEVTRIYSMAGMLSGRATIVRARPTTPHSNLVRFGAVQPTEMKRNPMVLTAQDGNPLLQGQPLSLRCGCTAATCWS
jgi:magnesium chelatase family protein